MEFIYEYIKIDTFFIVISILFLSLGLAGSLLPGIPGPPLVYISILILHLFTGYISSIEFLIVWAVIVIIVSVVDNWIQVYGVKIFGGNKKALIGSILGFFVGLLTPIPFGILVGTFFGAFFGAMLESEYNFEKAIKIAAGSIVGLITSTILKLGVSFYLTFKYLRLFSIV